MGRLKIIISVLIFFGLTKIFGYQLLNLSQPSFPLLFQTCNYAPEHLKLEILMPQWKVQSEKKKMILRMSPLNAA